MLLVANHLRDRLPLLFRGVDTRRIVRARMEQEHRALWRSLERRDEPGKVKPDGLRVVVRILNGLNPDVLKMAKWFAISHIHQLPGRYAWEENKQIITPSRVADINFRRPVPRIKSGEEQRAEMVGAGSGDRLRAHSPRLFDSSRVCARISFAAAAVYSGRPRIGKYSWSSVSSFKRIEVA